MRKFGWQFLALLLAIQPAVFFAQAVERPKPGFTLSIKEVAPSTLSDGYPADYHKLLVTYSNISDAAQKDWWDQLDSLDMLNMIVLRDGAPADELPAMSKLRKFREAVGSGRRLLTHDIHGPTSVTVTPSGQEFFIGDNPPAMNWGIQFNANATPPSGYTGTLTWIQLVQSFQYTWIYSDGDQPTTCTYTPGFDAGSPPSYPYATGAYAEDGPLIGLESPPNNDEIEQTASGQYQMYLMWNPSIGSGTSVSIPVPLGSLTWNIAGDVVWSAGTGAWVEVTADSNATTNGNFTTSSAYPTWQLPATPCQ